MGEPRHIPVLVSECLGALDPKPGEVYLDCTAGLGGHAGAIAERLGSRGTVVLIDLDLDNLERARARVEGMSNAPVVRVHHGSFAGAPALLAAMNLTANVVLADLGFASNQMEDPSRGLSFLRDGPLDMRLDPGAAFTAAELVNTLPERELADLIRDYGEDDAARKIAAKLVQARQGAPISTTGQLAAVVREAVGRRPGQLTDGATRTFQALRIAVNDELGSLERLLDGVSRGATRPGSWLSHGDNAARVGIISFHSLEDRPVKRVFAQLAARGVAEHIHRKPVSPGDAEIEANPRSRSAKLRAIRVVGPEGRGQVFRGAAA